MFQKFFLIVLLTIPFSVFTIGPKYPSQQGQDKWVIEKVFFQKKGGYFVDIGAADGVYISNTLKLEKDYNWSGICVEAHPVFFKDLKKNRKCTCVNACLDGVHKEVEFLYAHGGFHMLRGGIVDVDTDNSPTIRSEKISRARKRGDISKVFTKTLDEVLENNNAPKVIDYLSIDVEGAEERILTDLVLEKYIFLSVSIERPTPVLNDRLRKHGYVFVKNLVHDSLYVHSSFENIDIVQKEPFKQIVWKVNK